MVEAFLWGAVAGASLLLGGLIALVRPPHERSLGIVMAFGSGVLLAAVSFELVAEAVETSGGLGGTALGFFAGAIVFTVGDFAIGRLGYAKRKNISGEPPEGSGLSIVLGTLLDGIPESAVLGLTVLQTGEVGVAMLVAVFLSNLPEAVAASTSLSNGGWSPSRISGLWAGIAVISAVSASLGYALLDGAAGSTVAFVLAFAGGAILTMLATSMMPEAYLHAGHAVGLATVFGFGLAFGINWLEG